MKFMSPLLKIPCYGRHTYVPAVNRQSLHILTRVLISSFSPDQHHKNLPSNGEVCASFAKSKSTFWQ